MTHERSGFSRQDFGGRVAAAREALKLSQTTLAERLSVSRVQVGRWERGMPPGADVLASLAAELQVSADWLLTGRAPGQGPELPAAPLDADTPTAAE